MKTHSHTRIGVQVHDDCSLKRWQGINKRRNRWNKHLASFSVSWNNKANIITNVQLKQQTFCAHTGLLSACSHLVYIYISSTRQVDDTGRLLTMEALNRTHLHILECGVSFSGISHGTGLKWRTLCTMIRRKAMPRGQQIYPSSQGRTIGCSIRW